jgi:hypothetical protein
MYVMARLGHQRSARAWGIAADQDDVIATAQLLELGFTYSAIRHRARTGRLHLLWPGVWAVGSPHISQRGLWRAAVLTCGPEAMLSHEGATGLWSMRLPATTIAVSVPAHVVRRRSGIVIHRRTDLGAGDRREKHGIPVTSPALTLVDAALSLTDSQLEAAINEADRLDVIDPESLRAELDSMPRRPGIGRLRSILDRRTFVLTRSRLEQLFLPIARGVGLPQPQTQVLLNGFEVDFFWPELGLVVETDGLRYHRTPAQQARDRLRDQAHTAAGLTPLRFTHAQIAFEPGHVRRVLEAVVRRLIAR